MPRNSRSRDRLNHDRATVVAAQRRFRRRRFQRLKNEGLRPYNQPQLAQVIRLGWPSRAQAEAELTARLGRSGPLLFVHPDELLRLPPALRDELYLLERRFLGQLGRKLRYRRGPRDPWDWPLPATMLAGARSRERTRWRREVFSDDCESDCGSARQSEDERDRGGDPPQAP
jgi:hypothetical protein